MSYRPPPEANSFPADEAELSALVDRITQSPHFQRSKRLQSFLRYICEKAQALKPEEISEQHIGQSVFGRATGYNPAEDNIVRVEARELRKRLDAYFSREGLGESIVIDVPRGSYSPVFSMRSAGGPNGHVDATAVPQPPVRIARWPRWAVGFLCVGLLALSGWFWWQGERIRQVHQPPETVARFWGPIVNAGRPVVVAAADSSFALLQDLRRETVSFEDYASGAFFQSLKSRASTEAERLQQVVAARSHTSLADAKLYALILRLCLPDAGAELRFSREIRSQDLKSGNVIFLGSERSNPWSGLFAAWRNFQFEYDASSNRALFLNKQPRKGEPEKFVAGPLGPTATEAYGAIAFLPNLDRSGYILILAGTSMQGTEAVGELMTNGDKLESLARVLRIAEGDPWPYFEAIVELTAVEASSVAAKVVAHRTIDDSTLQKHLAWSAAK
jgi:hypothetical protein